MGVRESEEIAPKKTGNVDRIKYRRGNGGGAKQETTITPKKGEQPKRGAASSHQNAEPSRQDGERTRFRVPDLTRLLPIMNRKHQIES